MKLYHATTLNKYKKYKTSKCIHSPVRGFNTLTAAMAWAMKTNRTMIVEFETTDPHKLPDHHNKFGDAYWNDGNIHEYECVYSIH